MIPVVAVSGYPGSGKTSLARGLAGALPGALPVFMDDYERMTRTPIPDIARWMREGADIDAFEFPGLDDDLAALKQGIAVDGKRGRPRLAARKYVVFETQFGRAHGATGRHVDLQIWIDVPFDIALARNLKAFVAGFAAGDRADLLPERMRWLDEYLGNYLGTVRGLLEMQLERVGRKADVIVDGRAGIEAMVSAAVAEVQRRLP